MDELSSYLDKYKHLVPPEASKSKVLIDVVYKECGIALKEGDIKIVHNGVHLTCHPTVRSELSRCTPQILKALHKQHNIHFAFIR